MQYWNDLYIELGVMYKWQITGIRLAQMCLHLRLCTSPRLSTLDLKSAEAPQRGWKKLEVDCRDAEEDDVRKNVDIPTAITARSVPRLRRYPRLLPAHTPLPSKARPTLPPLPPSRTFPPPSLADTLRVDHLNSVQVLWTSEDQSFKSVGTLSCKWFLRQEAMLIVALPNIGTNGPSPSPPERVPS